MIPSVRFVRWTGKKPNSKGELPIMLQIVTHKKPIPKATGYKATVEEFSNGEFTSKASNYSLKNIALSNLKNKIEKELLLLYNTGITLTYETVHQVIHGKERSKDFFQFCLDRINNTDPQEGYIYKKPTKTGYYSEVMKLKSFQSEIRCAEIDRDFLKRYQAFCGTGNTVWKHMKFLRTIVIAAVDKKYIADNPFKGYKFPKYVNPDVVYLNLEELNSFWQVVAKGKLNPTERLCGLYFLRQCYSGLRISDNKRLAKEHISNNFITLTMTKTGRKVRVPVKNQLQNIIDLIANAKLMISDIHFNQYIRQIATEAGIEKRISSKVGRHTLGYLCAKYKIAPHITQAILGHAKIETTMIYYHLEDDVISEEMEKFNVA